MNNEVLRRKMFRTVLADSRAPAGILASSPEMVDTVSRRANGGLEARRKIAGQQFMRQFAGMPEGSRKPESYLQVLDRIKGLPYNQQVEELTKAGYGATIGPDVPDFLSRTGAAAKQRIGADIEQTKQTLGKILAPGADQPIIDAIQSGIVSVKDALGLIGPADAGMPGGPAPVKNRTPLSATDLVVPTDDDEFGNIAPDGTMPTNVLPAEDLSATQPVKTETETETETSTSPPKTGGDKPPKSNVNENKLNGMLQQAAAGTLITPSGKTKVKLNADEAADPKAAAVFKELVRPEDTSLSDMEERAKQIMGFDPDKAKADKKDAFWRNLTMAGLAIAAGESENALTNVAKGLMVGLDSYSKDIKEISAQDAELQKEYRATLRDLVKTDRDEKIALAAIENNYNAAKTDFEQRRNEFNTEQEYKQAVLGLDIEKFNKQALITLSSTLADLEIKQRNLALQEKTLDETVAQNAITNKLTEFKNQPAIKKLGIAIGYVDPETNEWNEEGLAWLDKTGRDAIMDLELLTGSSKNKTTDSDRDTAALAKFAAGDRSGPVVSRVIAMFPKALEEPELIPEALAALGANTSGANTGSAQIPEFDVEPDSQTLEDLAKSGVTQIKVGGKTFPIVQSN